MERPNIIMILTDDQGAWAMGCAGNRDVKTPNLDRLAEEGVRFENFFCASPVCSPARGTIFTGRMPSAHGVLDWIRGGNVDRERLKEKSGDPYYRNEDRAIPYLEGMTTYTDVLAREGYTCCLAGKWHLGDSLRPQHGFSKWFTIARGGCYYKKADVVENGGIRYESRYITDVITDKALEYIDACRAEQNPYYISVHYTAPHDPWDEDQHPRKYVEAYRDCAFTATPDLPVSDRQIQTAPYGTGEVRKSLLRGYYAAVTAMDAGVGRIVAHLKETGEYDHCILCFMADNGMNMGHHGVWGKGNATFPLNLYDTSVKVPFLVRWPGHTEPGRVIRGLYSQYDFFPSLLSMAGISVQAEGRMPGRSFTPVLEGAEQEAGPVVVYDEYGPNRMIRSKKWKFIRRYPYGEDELYHLAEDAEETVNLVEDEAYRLVREEMNDSLNHWFYRYADPAMDGAREGVTGHGQLRRPGIYSEGKEAFFRPEQPA